MILSRARDKIEGIRNLEFLSDCNAGEIIIIRFIANYEDKFSFPRESGIVWRRRGKMYFRAVLLQTVNSSLINRVSRDPSVLKEFLTGTIVENLSRARNILYKATSN